MTNSAESLPRSFLLKLPQLRWIRPAAISALLAIPCFWLPIVSSVDLQSHLYNAWLARLILHGGIHGLWIGQQSTNLLVDALLCWLMGFFDVSVVERVISTVLVLVFFWGAFNFVAAARGCACYWLTPWLAILAYGFVFQMGLLNYYISCGIVFWILAVVWKHNFGWRALWVAPLLIPAYLAHPLPILWLLGVSAYCWLSQRLKPRFHLVLFLSCIAVLFVIRCCIVARCFTLWKPMQLFAWTGADQPWVHGWPYLPVSLGFLLFSIVVLGKPENRSRVLLSLPAQAYFLTAAVIVLIPTEIGRSADGATAGIIATRLSLFSGVLMLAILSRSAYRRWYLPAGVMAATIFFGALHHDIWREARSEAKMKQLVDTLPAGSRIVSFADLEQKSGPEDLAQSRGLLAHLSIKFLTLNSGRLDWSHLISRACIGHCFDYLNYEPSTGQFRIHAAPGNPAVLATYAEFNAMASGIYQVEAGDLPLYALRRCGKAPEDILLQPMKLGETGAMLKCPSAGTQQ